MNRPELKQENERPLSLEEWGRNYGAQLTNMSEVNTATLVEIAEKVGEHLTQGKYTLKGKIKDMNLKINQIRRFLDAVRRIEADLKGKQIESNEKKEEFEEAKGSVMLLRPKLAYAAGREEQVKPLMNVLDPAIKSVAGSINDFNANFKKLLRLIESIIAYHTYYENMKSDRERS